MKIVLPKVQQRGLALVRGFCKRWQRKSWKRLVTAGKPFNWRGTWTAPSVWWCTACFTWIRRAACRNASCGTWLAGNWWLAHWRPRTGSTWPFCRARDIAEHPAQGLTKTLCQGPRDTLHSAAVDWLCLDLPAFTLGPRAWLKYCPGTFYSENKIEWYTILCYCFWKKKEKNYWLFFFFFRFLDSTLIDTEELMDDSNYRGTYGGCLATTLGSVLHELGMEYIRIISKVSSRSPLYIERVKRVELLTW